MNNFFKKKYINFLLHVLIFSIMLDSYSMTTSEKAIAIYEKNLISTFRNIDFNGNINFIHNISGFNTVKSFIHLHVKFNSSSTNRSPYVGYGWSLPFFESSFYQFADGLYVMNMPDGYAKIFIRYKKNPNILFSRGGWRATINKKIITAYNSKQKITYKSGRMTNLKTKDYNLNFKYNKQGVLKEIKEGWRTILKIKRTGQTTIIKTLNKTSIILSMSMRYVPRIRGSILSLSKLDFSDMTLRFIYSLDEHLNPQLKTEHCTFTWDLKTNLAKKINDYSYKVKRSTKNIIHSAAIIEHLPKYDRPDTFWEKNIFSGTEIYSAYGVKNITKSFVSGMLKGKRRKTEQYFQGKLIDKYDYSYNEKGKITRIIGLKTDWIYVYKSDGVTLVAKILNGKILKELSPDAKRLAKPYLNKNKSKK